jgi:hypothetical protein
MADALPFQNGVFEGKGHWISQRAEGDYTASYAISEGADGSTLHEVRRTFLTVEGSPLYVEETTVSLTTAGGNAVRVIITGPKGSVEGAGYWFGDQLHYEADISPGIRLEFTFTVSQGRIDGLASSTGKDSVTSWREILHEVRRRYPEPSNDLTPPDYSTLP